MAQHNLSIYCDCIGSLHLRAESLLLVYQNVAELEFFQRLPQPPQLKERNVILRLDQ